MKSPIDCAFGHIVVLCYSVDCYVQFVLISRCSAICHIVVCSAAGLVNFWGLWPAVKVQVLLAFVSMCWVCVCVHAVCDSGISTAQRYVHLYICWQQSCTAWRRVQLPVDHSHDWHSYPSIGHCKYINSCNSHSPDCCRAFSLYRFHWRLTKTMSKNLTYVIAEHGWTS